MTRKLRLNGVAGGDGIGNGMNSLFNRFWGTVLLFMVVMSSGGANSSDIDHPIPV